MHSRLSETIKALVSEGWSELQDQENVLPMRQWGIELLSMMNQMFGEETIVGIIDELYKETYKDEKENDNF